MGDGTRAPTHIRAFIMWGALLGMMGEMFFLGLPGTGRARRHCIDPPLTPPPPGIYVGRGGGELAPLQNLTSLADMESKTPTTSFRRVKAPPLPSSSLLLVFVLLFLLL